MLDSEKPHTDVTYGLGKLFYKQKNARRAGNECLLGGTMVPRDWESKS